MSQMQIDTDHIDRSIDDSKVIIEFSNILKNFKENPIDFDLFELINSFKKTALKKLLEIEQQSYSSNNNNNNSNDDLLNDWILESKFWNLIEILIRFKYSNEYNDNDTNNDTNNNNAELVNLSNDISQFNSNLIIKEKILINDSKLREIWLVISWLIDNFKLDSHSESDDITMNDLSVNKWLNTKIDLTNNKPNIIKNLNYDSVFDKNNTTFSNNNINIKNNLNIKDKENDSKFFQKAFFLLLEKDFNKLNELCELTNNWNFQLMLNGCQDFIDPKIDGSELFNSEKGTEELSTIGIKHQLLWRRTIYNLSQQKNTNNEELSYEKGCYSYLCGDLNSNIINLTNSWEKKLLIILNNLFQSLIEEKLINYLKISNKVDNYELNSILKNPKPLKSVNSINECFQILNGDNNQLIISQNQHPIRVLIGSIITNNLPKLMENLISMINNLTENDNLPENNNNVLTNEAYILRILIHLLIFMKLLDNDIISDKFFIKLIKTYILRLSLYKLYDEIPIYISLIPNENDIIEIYSFIISKFLINNNNEDKEFKVIKLNQLKLMKELNLPLEKILRNLNNYSFQITEPYYSSFEIVEINLNKFNLNVESNYDLNDFEIDSRLINSISWFIESNMITDALNSIIIAFRRFLLIGHIESVLKFNQLFNLKNLINDYNLRNSIFKNLNNNNTNDNDDDELKISNFNLSNKNLIELKNYLKLIEILQLINNYEQDKENYSNIESIYKQTNKFLTRFLVFDDNNTEEGEDDLIFQELKKLYIPLLFNKIFDILIENDIINGKNKNTIKIIELINLLSDDTFKFYNIFKQQNELKKFMKKLSLINCERNNKTLII